MCFFICDSNLPKSKCTTPQDFAVSTYLTRYREDQMQVYGLEALNVNQVARSSVENYVLYIIGKTAILSSIRS